MTTKTIAPPLTMSAAVYRRFGGPEVVRIDEIATPEPAPDEILIKVHATTVSAADHRSRARDIPAGLALPSSLVLGFRRPRRPVLGMDAAGIVVAVGTDVNEFAVGDEVVAMLGSRFGGHAQYAIVGQGDAIVHKPRDLDFESAVSIVFGGITAQAFLNQIDVRRGTTVLVNGASGAVGAIAVQLAAAVGAHVTAVTSAANSAMARNLGAQHTIDYAECDFAADGSTYDVIIDCVGNAPVRRVRGSVKRGGAVLLIAGDLRSLLTARRDAQRYGITVVTAPGSYRAEDLRYVMQLATDRVVQPTIDRAYALADIAEAHRYVDTGRKRGSVVVHITPTTTRVACSDPD
jgi:NADPH:quinone reductase-like Zn-dependent oxidoreductase